MCCCIALRLIGYHSAAGQLSTVVEGDGLFVAVGLLVLSSVDLYHHAPPPCRPGNPALCGSRPLVTPY